MTTRLDKLGHLTQDMTSLEDSNIDHFVEKLRRVCGRATLDLALNVGRLVVDTFYGGDLTLWRAHGKHHASLRTLARRQDLPISIPHLYRCVAIYEATNWLPDFSTWKHLSVSHVRSVLRLPPEDQRRLLALADEGNWTVQRLDSKVQALQSGKRSGRGRPPISERSRQLISIQALA